MTEKYKDINLLKETFEYLAAERIAPQTVLPILVALLKVRPGDLVIIENPEAHLHPKAQKLLGELAVKTSSAGAQIIIETHSDHILNGIRIICFAAIIIIVIMDIVMKVCQKI